MGVFCSNSGRNEEFAFFSGEERKGETQALKNNLLKPDKPFTKCPEIVKGCSTLLEVFS
jgi:hypothetical protein